MPKSVACIGYLGYVWSMAQSGLRESHQYVGDSLRYSFPGVFVDWNKVAAVAIDALFEYEEHLSAGLRP